MFELIIHFFIRDTVRIVTDDPATALAGIVMKHVARIECNSLQD